MASRPTHVLLLCENLALAGGVERFVCGLADGLAGRGLKVTLGSVDTPRERLAYPVGAAVDVVARGRRGPVAGRARGSAAGSRSSASAGARAVRSAG
jgi:hypothetical protein